MHSIWDYIVLARRWEVLYNVSRQLSATSSKLSYCISCFRKCCLMFSDRSMVSDSQLENTWFRHRSFPHSSSFS